MVVLLVYFTHNSSPLIHKFLCLGMHFIAQVSNRNACIRRASAYLVYLHKLSHVKQIQGIKIGTGLVTVVGHQFVSSGKEWNQLEVLF